MVLLGLAFTPIAAGLRLTTVSGATPTPCNALASWDITVLLKNILLTFLIFELGDPKIYMSIR